MKNKISFEKYIQMQCYVAAEIFTRFNRVEFVASNARMCVDAILELNNCEVEDKSKKPEHTPDPSHFHFRMPER